MSTKLSYRGGDGGDYDQDSSGGGHGGSGARHRRSRKSWRSIGRSNPRLKAPGRFEQLLIGLMVGAAIGFAAGWFSRPPWSTVVLGDANPATKEQREDAQAAREREALETIRSLNDSNIRRNGTTPVEDAEGRALSNGTSVLAIPAPVPGAIAEDTRHPLRVRTGN